MLRKLIINLLFVLFALVLVWGTLLIPQSTEYPEKEVVNLGYPISFVTIDLHGVPEYVLSNDTFTIGSSWERRTETSRTNFILSFSIVFLVLKGMSFMLRNKKGPSFDFRKVAKPLIVGVLLVSVLFVAVWGDDISRIRSTFASSGLDLAGTGKRILQHPETLDPLTMMMFWQTLKLAANEDRIAKIQFDEPVGGEVLVGWQSYFDKYDVRVTGMRFDFGNDIGGGTHVGEGETISDALTRAKKSSALTLGSIAEGIAEPWPHGENAKTRQSSNDAIEQIEQATKKLETDTFLIQQIDMKGEIPDLERFLDWLATTDVEYHEFITLDTSGL